MKELKSFDISIEEFDKLEGNHVFSENYQKQKGEAISQYKKKMERHAYPKFVKVAAAIALMLVLGPITANAATNGEMFSRVWGGLGKNDIKAHDEVIQNEEKGNSCVVTFPKREYETMDVERAQQLIGKYVVYPSVSKEINGTTISVKSAVRDKDSAVVEYTLEKKGGVNMLEYSQRNNETKGALFSENSTVEFSFGEGLGFIYVDLDKSTDEKLYCYSYLALVGSQTDIDLEIDEYPCTLAERQKVVDSLDDKALRELNEKTKITTVKIPLSKSINMENYVNNKRGCLELSPLSMKIDMKTGLGLSKEEASDPYSCYYVSVNYKDGSNYVVTEHSKEGVHSCDIETENTSYALENEGKLILVFNRLVDTEKVKSVTVNNVEYTLK